MLDAVIADHIPDYRPSSLIGIAWPNTQSFSFWRSTRDGLADEVDVTACIVNPTKYVLLAVLRVATDQFCCAPPKLWTGGLVSWMPETH
jgi:hypothetical protein